MQVVKIAGEGGDQITETSNALDVHIKSGSSGLPSGAATSALQTALNNLIGEVQASPTSNTLLDRLKQIHTELSVATSISTGTKTCDTSAGRLKASTLANTVSLTVKIRSMGDASYIAIGGSGSQDFRLTAERDSMDLDVDPYAVYVKDDHSSTAAVVEYLARVSA